MSPPGGALHSVDGGTTLSSRHCLPTSIGLEPGPGFEELEVGGNGGGRRSLVGTGEAGAR